MREDVAALTPEALIALSNAGLVKRAQREIAEGQVPVIETTEDDAIVGRCHDGAAVRWPPGKSLRDAACSCGAPQVCRHRVAVALAYGPWARSSVSNEASIGPDRAPLAFDAWWPGDIDDAALLEHLGARTVEAARALRARGVIARVRGPSVAEPIPSAALPSCTVRFLAPRAVAFARCDCRIAEACPHIALAVWAFRVAPRDAPSEAHTVELASANSALDEESLAPILALARWILSAGVAGVAGSDAWEQRAALARAPLAARGYTWMLDLVDDVERLLGAYRRRAASYRARTALELVSEIEARRRSAFAPAHALPPAFVLGRDTPMETRLDHVRLTALGARVTVESDRTRVRVLLVNPETADVLVIDREFDAEVDPSGKASPLDARAVGARRLGGATVAAIASAHVVTRVATRRANGALGLAANARGSTSVTPQGGDLGGIAAPCRAASADAITAYIASRPPALLRPRRLGEEVFVLPIQGVEGAAFDAAEQAVFATLRTASGVARLVRHHARGVDVALDALGAALQGASGPLRWVVGEVSIEHGELVVDPTMLVTDRVIVPDFASDAPPLALPAGRLRRGPADAVDARVELVERLTEMVHAGVANLPPTFGDRLRRASASAASAGHPALGERGEALAAAVRLGRPDVFDRFCDLAIRAQLCASTAGPHDAKVEGSVEGSVEDVDAIDA